MILRFDISQQIAAEEPENIGLTVEGILKNYFEDIARQAEKIELEKDKAVDDLLESYARQAEEGKFKIEAKYNEVLLKSESLPQSIREASIKKLKAGREAELKKELERVKAKFKAEKDKLSESAKENLRAATLPTSEKVAEVSSKIKELIATVAKNAASSPLSNSSFRLKKGVFKSCSSPISVRKCI